MGREQALRVDGLTPLGVDPNNLGPVAVRDLAHAFPEHTVDTDDDRIARADEVDEGRLHARRSGPAERKGQGVGCPESLTQAVVRAVENRQELRIQMTEHRTGQRHGDFGVRIRRSRPHEEAVGYPHRRIVAGPRSPAPTRRPAGWRSTRLPAWSGCSSPRGRCRPSLPTWPRIPPPTRPGPPPVRRNGPERRRSSRRANLCLVMPVVDAEADADADDVRRTLREPAAPARWLVAHRDDPRGPAARDPAAGAHLHRACATGGGCGSSAPGGPARCAISSRSGSDPWSAPGSGLPWRRLGA